MGLFSAFSHYVFNDCGPNRGFHNDFRPFPHFNTVKIVICPSKFWLLVEKVNLGQDALFCSIWTQTCSAKKAFLSSKTCTVSGIKRQFDKWHLFGAPTRITPKNTLLGVGVHKERGACEIFPAGVLKICTATPLPWQTPYGQKWGRGGGGMQFLPGLQKTFMPFSRQICLFGFEKFGAKLGQVFM